MKNIFNKSFVALLALAFIFGGVFSSVNKAKAATLSFAAPTYFPVGAHPNGVRTTADFNGDGKLDIATTNYNSGDVSILLGTGTGSFGAATNFSVGPNPFSIAVGDVNGDGKLDIVTGGFSTISVILGTGTGSFGSLTSIIGSGVVKLADFNGDHKLDLSIVDSRSANLVIRLGNGNGTFGSANSFPVVSGPYDQALGDFNGDGKIDVVTANGATNNASILLGNGNGTFGIGTNFAAGATPSNIIVADFNNDGKLDFAVTNGNGFSISVFLGSGLGSFGSALTFSTPWYPATLVAGDFNDDNKIDLVTDAQIGISVHLGNGDGTFGSATNFLTALGTDSMVAGDFNGDGKLDLAANGDTDKVSVFINTTPDDIAPTGSITINTNAPSTNSTSTVLNLSATDAVGVTGYFVSESPTTPTISTSGWIAVTSTTSYYANVLYTFLNNTNGTKTVYVWYKDAAGNISATSSDAITLDTSLSIPAVATGIYNAIDLRADGTVWTWGYNGFGELGNGITGATSYVPVQVHGPLNSGFLTGIISIAEGNGYFLALKNDGTVWAWGWNNNGQLGNGTTANSNVPVQVSSLSGITTIAAGQFHSLAIKNDGTVWTWGLNDNGQLGNGNTGTNSSIPVQVHGVGDVGFLTGIVAIAGGEIHSLAVKNDGTFWSWGSNGLGQLGIGGGALKNTPVQVHGPLNVGFLSGITAIAAGSGFSLALKNDGTVWAIGNNSNGQFGNGVSGNTGNVPVQVHGPLDSGFLTGITAIATVGGNTAFALKNDGTVWAWGAGNSGILGNGTSGVISNVPVQVHGPLNVGFLTGVTAIGGGPGAVSLLAVKNDGTVWAWGYNASNGYLATGSQNPTFSSVPLTVVFPAPPMTGSGTLIDPYIVTSCSQLQNMSINLSANYKLANDIDCSATSSWNAGAGFEPVGKDGNNIFSGSFNGNNKKITGLFINRPSTSIIGLFGLISSATITNIGMEGINITGLSNVGGLVGINNLDATVSNSYTTGSVSGNGNFTGGLVGNSNGTILNSYSTANVSGPSYVGGLLGFAGVPTITTNSYSTGNVSGSSNVGGLIGSIASGGTINNSFWNTQTSGQASGCGSGVCTGATGKTTAQMKTQSTFTSAGWNFAATWDRNDFTNAGYPYFKKSIMAGTGTSANPFIITTCYELQDMKDNLSAYYKLNDDIDCSMTNVGAGFAPIGDINATAFSGNFNGNGKKITGLYINRPSAETVGLFGYIAGGTISNVGVESINITGWNF